MKSSKLRTVFDLVKLKNKISGFKEKTLKAGFWKHPQKAGEITKEISGIEEEVNFWQNLEKQIRESLDLLKISQSDPEIVKEIKTKYQDLQKAFKKEESKVFLSGKYDKGPALLSILAGAGGQDSQDWATMLLRMYERYCQRKGFKTKILHQSFGEGGGPDGRIGTKSATLEIRGVNSYGFLKKESGVHRLVRISPFSPQKLRHTSFALVEILPEVEKEMEKEIKIKAEDLKIDFYRASGPGGQYVNRRETAVRITHLPTGFVASCQSERLQGQNRETAMKILYAKLKLLKEKEKKEELSQIKGKTVSASWGNQIRSYVLHPYKLVKDLRTNVETSGVESVLDGNLDKFVEAEIKIGT